MTTTMNEMASGCCVCSDERGWAENPLVYCDGAGCNIGVHKACYGIVTVPSGNWYCRKCESQERSARVRCELCPSRDGALKRTDNNGWAHVVCGLYIPEVRFGSVTTMEPILLSQIPAERFNKVCYICEQNNRGRASMGACMQCNKAGCKQQFHVTCAQALGLLCEEPGNYMDNVKYCGYCQEHYMKLKKNSNVKTIPPYKPTCTNNSGSDESPEKKLSNFNPTTDLKQTTKRKSVGSRPNALNGPSRIPGDRKEIQNQIPSADHVNGARNVTTPSPNAQLQLVKERTPTAGVGPTISVASNLPQVGGSNDANSRFTTSNFVEGVVAPSESVFAEVQKNKKRKINEANVITPPVSLPSVLGGQSSQQQPQLSTSTPTPAPSPSELERTNSKLSANQDDENEDDDDSGDLKFVEEPNLSTLKPETTKPSTSTTESTSGVSSVISSVASATAVSLGVNPFTSSSTINHTPHAPVSASTALKTSVASVKSHQNVPASNPVTSSCLSAPSASIPDTKVAKFQNSSNAPHMLGNQLNPASSMAQKMFDSLNDELEAHSIFTPTDSSTNLNNFVGPPLYNKIISATRAKEATKRSNSPSNGGPLASLSGSAANFPQTLEELLEKQWEQGGTFLMEQAQHFDIASLLTCLHKLREENLELEDHIRKLKARRDRLLGVGARLAMPLAPVSQPVNSVHSSSQTAPARHASAATSQPVSHLSLHHQISHAGQGHQQPAHQPPSVLQPSLPPPAHHNISHSQPSYHQASANASLSGAVAGGNSIMSDGNQLRNIPLPSGMYASAASANLRDPHNSVYRNPHSMGNGLMSHHHPARAMPVMSSAGNRHHGSTSNTAMYATSQPSQSSNPGVVVRAPHLPVSEVGRNDRRNPTVMSSNY